jgi:hypothetical protein
MTDAANYNRVGRASADLRDAILTCLGYSPPIRLPGPKSRRTSSQPRPYRRKTFGPCSRVDRIKQAVAAYYGVTTDILDSPTRGAPEIAQARQAAIYLARQHTDKSLPHIGRLFGGRDHTTILYAVRAVAKRAQADRCFAAELEEIAEDAGLSTEALAA